MKILFADDDIAWGDRISQALRKAGHEVKSVFDGRELLAEIERERYDLVITDDNMPITTGIEALRQIRANDDLKNLPVIMLSGSYKSADEARQLGATFIGLSARMVNELLKAVNKNGGHVGTWKQAFDLIAKIIAEKDGVNIVSITEETEITKEVFDEGWRAVMNAGLMRRGDMGFGWSPGKELGDLLDDIL